MRLLYSGEWKVPDLTEPQSGEAAAPMILIAEAFARGNSKTDGFRSRLVPVPKAMMSQGLLGVRPSAVAKDVQLDLDAIEAALRDGLSLIAAEGDREKRKKSHYERAQSAREAYRRAADRLFFPDIAKRAIPCASLFRLRAEARGKDAFERGVAKALRPIQPQEVQDV